MSMRRKTILSLKISVIAFSCLLSCISIDVPGQVTFLGTGSIVLKGIMSESATDACPVWESNRGELFVLFQDANLSNEDFDAIIEPGTQSRLLLQGRPDLGVVCLEGAENAVVLEVFEIDGVDQVESKLEELRIRADALSEEVRAGLASRRDEIASDLQDSLDDLKTRLQEREDQLEADVQATIDAVRDKLQDAPSIEMRFTQFSETLRERISDGAGEFGKAKENLRNQIDQRIDELAEIVKQALDEARERLEQNPGQLLPNNDELIEKFRNRIAKIQERLEGDFEQRKLELLAELDELSDQFENDLQDIVDRLVGRITSETSDLDGAIPAILDEQGLLIDEVVDEITMSRAGLRAQIRAALQASLDNLEMEIRQRLLDAVDEALIELVTTTVPEA